MSVTHRQRISAFATSSRLLAPAVALTAVVGGTAFYSNSGVSLDLAVDGQTQQVDSRADSVGDLLDSQSIELTSLDAVSPGVDTPLRDGQTVEVRYARPFEVIVDGRSRSLSTTELTVGAALADAGISVQNAETSLPLDAQVPREGASVSVTHPKKLTLVVGANEPQKLTSAAATVSDLLDEQDVAVTTGDKLSHAEDAPVAAGMTVKLTRVRTENVTKTEKVAYKVVEKKDSSLTAGTRKTVTPGVAGKRTATYKVTYTNGKTTAKKLVTAEVASKPVAAVVKVGTKPVSTSSSGSSGSSSSSGSSAGSSGGSSGGLNWAALAECESSGNPKAANPAGYYGLYQFSLSTWRSVGGSGNPASASSAEQTKRAQILYNKAGAGQWPVCGKKLFT